MRERFEINCLTIHFKVLENEEKADPPQSSMWEDIVEISQNRN